MTGNGIVKESEEEKVFPWDGFCCGNEEGW